jgi:excisionase family DNA binding protein
MDELITTKQVQDLLQVDRITVYRMLKDGRLTGVKVGSHWRVPKSEIDELITGKKSMEEPRKLAPSEILPVHCLQIIQDVFADMTEIGSLTTDPQGNPLNEVSNSCEFCQLMLSNLSGRQACIQSWKEMADSTSEQPQFRRCHAGLQYACSRIDVDGDVVGVQMAGQFYVQSPDEAEQSVRLQALAAEHDIDLDALTAAAANIPVHAKAQQQRVAKWLARLAETFEIIALERADLIGRLKNIAEMSSF